MGIKESGGKMEKEKIKFEDLGIAENIVKALEDYGYEEPTPIQEKTIPFIIQGRDLIGQSQTGTGKTASFGLPLIQKIDINLNKVQGLILCPTRELALQVTRRIKKIH
jgi:ATP-dependent RNA helicase DeaD